MRVAAVVGELGWEEDALDGEYRPKHSADFEGMRQGTSKGSD